MSWGLEYAKEILSDLRGRARGRTCHTAMARVTESVVEAARRGDHVEIVSERGFSGTTHEPNGTLTHTVKINGGALFEPSKSQRALPAEEKLKLLVEYLLILQRASIVGLSRARKETRRSVNHDTLVEGALGQVVSHQQISLRLWELGLSEDAIDIDGPTGEITRLKPASL